MTRDFVTAGQDGDVIDAEVGKVTAAEAVEIVRELLADGCTSLTIQGSQLEEDGDRWRVTVEAWCAAVGNVGSTVLERFAIDTYFQPLTRQASVQYGDATGVFARCPSLAHAHLIGTGVIRELAHDHLEVLTLMGEPLGSETVRAVLRGPLPRLRRLDLGFAYEQEPAKGIDGAFLAALPEAGLPALAELHLGYPEDALAVLAGLAKSGLLARLRVVSLLGNLFDDEEAAVAMLREHASAFRHLERFHLPIEDMMETADDELRAIIPGFCGNDDGSDAFRPLRS